MTLAVSGNYVLNTALKCFVVFCILSASSSFCLRWCNWLVIQHNINIIQSNFRKNLNGLRSPLIAASNKERVTKSLLHANCLIKGRRPSGILEIRYKIIYTLCIIQHVHLCFVSYKKNNLSYTHYYLPHWKWYDRPYADLNHSCSVCYHSAFYVLSHVRF